MRDPRAIWAEVPSPGCKGLCTDNCTVVPVAEREVPLIGAERTVKVDRLHLMATTEKSVCASLDQFGRCAVYDNRPLLCRLYGATPQLACDHGCQPTITHEHASALTREMFGIEES